jgi:hypothetical protein
MRARVPHHAVRRDRIPVGPLDLDDDKHLLIAVRLNGQVDAPPPTPDEPPLTFPESRCPGGPGKEGRLDGPVESLACRQSLDRHNILRAVGLNRMICTMTSFARFQSAVC